MNFLIKLVGNFSHAQCALTLDIITELQFGMSKVSISKFNEEVVEIADVSKVSKKMSWCPFKKIILKVFFAKIFINKT